jgi:iron complex outermembrane receptor protein
MLEASLTPATALAADGVSVWGCMSKSSILLAHASALVLGIVPQWARAAASDPTVSEVVVTVDRAGLLERNPSATVFGINKPLIETPRSASFISDTTLDRYGILTLDKLTAISPGTYTASYYGVPGSVEIRGTLAENYFRGFKRIENRGTYTTPIGDAAQIEVLRGPPTPIYGPGKIGGLVNFIPKSARNEGRLLSGPTGEITLTGGSYDKKNATGQVGLPLHLGTAEGGFYAYGELEDSGSVYRGVHPKHQLAEISADFNLGDGWTTAFDAMAFSSSGDVQTPGWNRLTQDLIDHQTYVTGHNTVLVDANHDGRLEPGEVGPGPAGSYPFGTSLYQPYFGFPPGTDPRFVLNAGVGTTKLSPRTVFVSPLDFSRTGTATFYYELAKDLGGDKSVKLQLFYDNLSNKRFVSYGFPADYHAWTTEVRASYAFPLSVANGFVATRNLVGASYRYYKGEQKESYGSGLISLDRRDLSVGPTPTDVFDAPFFHSPGGLQWETDIKTRHDDVGVFAMSDITVGGRLNLMLGGRYDRYSVNSIDVGLLDVFDHVGPTDASNGKWTYSASASYKLPFGLMPYVTYASAAALEVEQAGNIKPSNVIHDGWLSSSDLTEGGVKFQLFGKRVVGSVAGYGQNRTQLSGLSSIVQATRSTGVEYEIRYLATKNLSITLSGDSQHTEIIGPDHSLVYIPPSTAGAAGVNAYGGAYLVFDFAQLPGRSGDYSDSLIPHTVVSLFGAYTSDDHAWGRAGGALGVTYASKTSGLVQDAVVYPAYELVNLSLFWQRRPYAVSLNIDNLLDKLYFTPDQDTYANVGVLPGRGREWRITLKRSF